MKFDKIHNKGQARIFKNQYLEKFVTKTHPLLIWAIYLPFIIYLPYYSSTKYLFSDILIALIFLGGIFFWTFFEYLIHRFIFHWVSENPRMKRFAYVMHGNHHEFPSDRQRLFMPAVPSIILSFVIFGVMYCINAQICFCIFPGLYFRIPALCEHALCHTCMEPSF